MISPLTAKRRPPNPLYPDDDGLPMSDNTRQFNWIVTIKENLEALFASRDDVFVAGNLLWYAIEGRPEIRLAPDAMVVFGRPKGYRGSYMQWEEDGIPPTVVFEVLSPGNRPAEMTRKFQFYDRHGVDEYYLFDPDSNDLDGWRRIDDALEEIAAMDGWTSPRLGIRFELADDELTILHPDGSRFLTYVESVVQREEEAKQRRAAVRARAREEKRRIAAEQGLADETSRREAVEQARALAEQDKLNAEAAVARLREQLRRLGVDPNE